MQYSQSEYRVSMSWTNGTKVLGNDNSWAISLRGAKVPGIDRPGTKLARGELVRVLLADSLRGVNEPGSRKTLYLKFALNTHTQSDHPSGKNAGLHAQICTKCIILHN